MSCAPRHTPRTGLFELEAAPDRLDLLDEKRIGVGLVDPDRAAEDDQEIGSERIVVKRIEAGLAIGEFIAMRAERVAPDADVLESDVAKSKRGLHLSPSRRGRRVQWAAHRPIA